MNRRLLCVLSLLALLSCSLHARFNPLGVKASVEYRVHNLNTRLNYTSIQEAIDAPETLNGHTIFVQEGTYNENVVLGKSYLTLIGENKSSTVIDGSGKGVAVTLKANNTQIKAFTVQNGSCGIEMSPWTAGHIIQGNIILNNDYGVSGHYDCANVSICDNMITSNNVAGIEMLFSHSVIRNNLIFNNGKGEFLQYSSGILIESGVFDRTIYCVENTVYGNTIKNHRVGIEAAQYSEENLFVHNNFVNNTKQVSASASQWNNSAVENYWSDYGGIDPNNDGIGDIAYKIDDVVQDEHPLMGMFSEFNVSIQLGKSENVAVISNSTVSDLDFCIWLTSPYKGLQPGQSFVQFSATGENGSVGFCRLMVPRTVLNSSTYLVLVDYDPINATELSVSNSTHVYLYFTYAHSTHEVIVTIPESSLLIVPLFTMATVLAVIACKRKRTR
jgi:parallel beta-helix repeat protein